MPLTKATTNVVNLDKDTLINGLTAGKGGGNISSNTALGTSALFSNTTGIHNTASGTNALFYNTTGAGNTANGVSALQQNTTGNYNVAVGIEALQNNTGNNNTAVGTNALDANTTGNNNTAVGIAALASNTTYSNIGGFGYNAQVTASNQVQLGDAATTTYAYGAVQNRSDIRDKADVRDTELGLEFVNALRPVDFKWDMREDYRPEAPVASLPEIPIMPNAPIEPVAPKAISGDATEEEKQMYEMLESSYRNQKERYDKDVLKHQEDIAKYNEAKATYDAAKAEFDKVQAKWIEDSKLSNITHDGSKKRSRFHHGLIAQEVLAVMAEKNIDFGGFQDHKVKGGDDVLSIGYNELIAPMIKAIQELSAKVAELEAK